MKSLVLVGLLIVGLFSACATSGGGDRSGGATFRHVVLFKFKADAAPADITAVEAAFAELPRQIDSIVDFEWGTDVSPEGTAQGYTHCFLVTFADAAGRDAYLPHPAHQAFVAKLRPYLESALVVDYEARR